MRRAVAAFSASAGLLALLAVAGPAPAAELVVSVNKANQTMSVQIDGVERHAWKVSTGLGGGPYAGSYKPGRMERKWFSRKYNMAPMPYSIFFDGNYAIHGTTHVKRLGQRASKGCVRLHPQNGAILFELVRKHGSSGTSIVISNTTHVAVRSPVPSDVEAPAAKTVEKPKVEASSVDTAKIAAPLRETTAQAPAMAPAAEKVLDVEE